MNFLKDYQKRHCFLGSQFDSIFSAIEVNNNLQYTWKKTTRYIEVPLFREKLVSWKNSNRKRALANSYHITASNNSRFGLPPLLSFQPPASKAAKSAK